MKTLNQVVAMGSKTGLPPMQLMNTCTNFITTITNYLTVAQEEKTKRTDITARRDVALAAIQKQRDTISELMRYTFKERAAVLQQQFKTLDDAIANGNVEVINASLNAMVNVIQTSPFKDIASMQTALNSKDFVMRLE